MKTRCWLLGLLLALPGSCFAQTDEDYFRPVEVIGAMKTPDKKAVTVSYLRDGKTNEVTATFPGEISEMMYSPWLNGAGVAVAASVSVDGVTRFYWVATHARAKKAPRPAPIDLPATDLKLTGIVGTGGDSVMITFAKHVRGAGKPETISGWYYLNNCPMFGGAEDKFLDIGKLVPFEAVVPAPTRVKEVKR